MAPALKAKTISHAFEFKCYTPDAKANGETDFKGKSEYLTTDQRIDFLGRYAAYASRFFNDPGLDRKVVQPEEVEAFLARLKPQPEPTVRTRIVPATWKWTACRPGQRAEEQKALKRWAAVPGVAIRDGALFVTDPRAEMNWSFPPIAWRGIVELDTVLPRKDARSVITLSGDKGPAITVGFDGGRLVYRTNQGTRTAGPCKAGTTYSLMLEVDLTTRRYNLYLNGALIADYVEMQDTGALKIDRLTVTGVKGQSFDNVHVVDYPKGGKSTCPYGIETRIDESFGVRPDIDGWQTPGYDDRRWRTAPLPIVHGGERQAGEDLYLRQTVKVGAFERAELNIEEICEAGEIWINGEVAAVIRNRYPIKLDVTEFIKANAPNTIAIRVKAFQPPADEFVHKHTPSDRHIGWFMGRMSLDLTPRVYIDDVFVHTKSLAGNNAANRNVVTIANIDPRERFTGSVEITYTKWFPKESATPASTKEFPVNLPGHRRLVLDKLIEIAGADLWTSDSPNLYKVQVVLKNKDGKAIDDRVVTTGIRTVSQQGGTFRINGKPAMLNGTQTMGFRTPLEIIAKYARCAPVGILAEEMLMNKKMNANLLRVHNHSFVNRNDGINDPRIPEMADQMGTMLIWLTPAWIRSQNPWVVDFKGYPKYMKLVRNHPSIVMWEASNHPEVSKYANWAEANEWFAKVYNTIHPNDPSRLISVTSHYEFTPFRSDTGILERGGKIVRRNCPEYTAPMVTRGNQDAVTGYQSSWTKLRNWPGAWRQAMLDSKERAYFNFEHEESIAQPNWSLVKGKPWYHLYSYERKYDRATIGRPLNFDQWRESQAWQAMSAYESMRKQRMLGYDGFSWCCLHGGANMGTYMKPLIDCTGAAKLAWYANKMVFQNVLAGSSDVDMVYGPGDVIKPMVLNLGDERTVSVRVEVKNEDGAVIGGKTYTDVKLSAGRTVRNLPPFKPPFKNAGCYAIEYTVIGG